MPGEIRTLGCDLAQGAALRPHRSLIHYGPQFESPMGKQKDRRMAVCLFGAPGEIRTLDLPVRSRALYPLSYGRNGHSGMNRNAYLL